ncbi:MAG: type I-B CRISPR-associated protein Cas7/Cst2/DevR, partial [Deltaproteobacteria bacterium]|nr:type I-B CRISPR-associated protein Cas7/Cst2/DevR [Deltaproteobacteria bacterium]
MNDLNLFATVLTHAAPSSNYRGESEENRTVIQKISKGGHEYSVISPESMRNALREMLAAKGLPLNRSRLHDEDQLAVKYESFPDASKYADDFLFGFMVADPNAVKKNKGMPAKRDSVLRMNLALALAPYRFDATFHQSPLSGGENPPFKNASTSALLHREVAWTAYQYPFALALGDCRAHSAPQWTRALLECIGELS